VPVTGIAYKGNTFGPKEARHTLDVNFVGTANVCEAMLPLLTQGGRIVNVCSMAGKRRIIKSSKLLGRFEVHLFCKGYVASFGLSTEISLQKMSFCRQVRMILNDSHLCIPNARGRGALCQQLLQHLSFRSSPSLSAECQQLR